MAFRLQKGDYEIIKYLADYRILPISQLAAVFRRKINGKFRHGWRMLPCVKVIQETSLADGSRHRIYMILARYYSYLNMHHDEILERIEGIDARNPIRDADYIERIINFGQKHPGFSGCAERELQEYCRNNNCFYAKLKTRAGKNRKTRERTLFKET